MISAWFLARGRVPALRGLGYVFLHVRAFGRDGRVFVWSLIMHEECDLFAEPGRMEFGIMGTTVDTWTAVAVVVGRP